MNVVFVGNAPGGLTERMKVVELHPVAMYKNNNDLLDALRDKQVTEFEKVILMPTAFSATEDNFDRITEIQNELEKLPYKPILMIFGWNKDSYNVIVRDSLIKYRNTILYALPSSLKWSVVHPMMKNNTIVDIPGAVYTDTLPKKATESTPIVEEEPVAQVVEKLEIPDFLKPPAKIVDEPELTQEDFTQRITRFLPPVGEYKESDAKTIVVCSLSPGAGSTFLANNAATILARETQPTAVVEYFGNEPMLGSYIEDASSKPEYWKSIATRVVDGSTVNGRDYWKRFNTYWFPLDEKDMGMEFDKSMVKDLMRATKVSRIGFVDISTNWNDARLEDVFDDAFEIWAVFRPNIGNIQRKLNEFKESMTRWSEKTLFIGNGFDGYTSRDTILEQIDRLISSNPEILANKENPNARRAQETYPWKNNNVACVIPMQASSCAYSAEWNGKPLAACADGGAEIRNAMGSLLNSLAPDTKTTISVPEPKKSGKGLMGLFKKGK